MKSKLFSIVSVLILTVAALPSGSRCQDRRGSGGTMELPTKVFLPYTLQNTQLDTNLWHIKLTVTNNTGTWLAQGKKIYWKNNWGSQGSMKLDAMIPLDGKFILLDHNALIFGANGFEPKPPDSYEVWYLK